MNSNCFESQSHFEEEENENEKSSDAPQKVKLYKALYRDEHQARSGVKAILKHQPHLGGRPGTVTQSGYLSITMDMVTRLYNYIDKDISTGPNKESELDDIILNYGVGIGKNAIAKYLTGRLVLLKQPVKPAVKIPINDDEFKKIVFFIHNCNSPDRNTFSKMALTFRNTFYIYPRALEFAVEVCKTCPTCTSRTYRPSTKRTRVEETNSQAKIFTTTNTATTTTVAHITTTTTPIKDPFSSHWPRLSQPSLAHDNQFSSSDYDGMSVSETYEDNPSKRAKSDETPQKVSYELNNIYRLPFAMNWTQHLSISGFPLSPACPYNPQLSFQSQISEEFSSSEKFTLLAIDELSEYVFFIIPASSAKGDIYVIVCVAKELIDQKYTLDYNQLRRVQRCRSPKRYNELPFGQLAFFSQ